MGGKTLEAYLSRDEIEAAYLAMTARDHARFRRASLLYAMSADRAADLRQQALVNVLSGDRKCPRNLKLLVSLIQAVRSLVSAAAKAAARWKAVEHEMAVEALVTANDREPSAEQAALEGESADQIYRSVIALFEDDSTAQTVVEGIMAEYTGEELCELADIEPFELATVRRLIKRRITSAYPNGWAGEE